MKSIQDSFLSVAYLAYVSYDNQHKMGFRNVSLVGKTAGYWSNTSGQCEKYEWGLRWKTNWFDISTAGTTTVAY